MIFRRRRTRIEIEQTTVRLDGGNVSAVVAPPTPPSGKPILARVLPFPVRETNESAATNSAPTVSEPVKETLS